MDEIRRMHPAWGVVGLVIFAVGMVWFVIDPNFAAAWTALTGACWTATAMYAAKSRRSRGE